MALPLLALTLAAATPETFEWAIEASALRERCAAQVAQGEQAARSALGGRGPAPRRLIAVEGALAGIDDALVAERLLQSVSPDEAVRAASAECTEAIAGVAQRLSGEPRALATAQVALAAAKSPADRMLAKLWVERGRRAGAHLGPAARRKLEPLFARLTALQSQFVQTLFGARETLELTAEETAGLPGGFVDTLQRREDRYLVPVDLRTQALVLENASSAEVRRRFVERFFQLGGEENSRRLREALKLRHQLARALGFPTWAAYQLDAKMAKTPARAQRLVRELGARLLPRAREELATLTALKSELGDPTPLMAWDHAYYLEQLGRRRAAVDSQGVREYLPLDHVLPAALKLYQRLLGVRIERREPSLGWHPDAVAYELLDEQSGARLATFFVDLPPREGKGLRPSYYTLRSGRRLADGSWRPSVCAVIGNGPAAAPGKPALLSHQDALELFHELGHVMHGCLSRAPYASLNGAQVRGDFVEAPSQLMENWLWRPAVLAEVSRHVTTGKPMPPELIDALGVRRQLSPGIFWTRQAFLASYDLALHSRGDADPTALWFELMPRLTPLPPPPPGTRPDASFLPLMGGGYDAGYYGYLWSRVYAQDLYSVFTAPGRDERQVGRWYRETILEPGGSEEPEVLLRWFLGRPVSYDGFYRDLGLLPPER